MNYWNSASFNDMLKLYWEHFYLSFCVNYPFSHVQCVFLGTLDQLRVAGLWSILLPIVLKGHG